MDVGIGVALVEGTIGATMALELSAVRGREIVAEVVRVSEVVDVAASSEVRVESRGAGPTLGRAWTWPSEIWDTTCAEVGVWTKAWRARRERMWRRVERVICAV